MGKRKILWKCMHIILAVLFLWAGSSVADIIFVDKTGDNTDGTSWETAWNDLQTALDEAEVGDQIWVAKGTYVPTTPIGAIINGLLPDEPDSRRCAFQMKNGVAIRGGFAGDEDPLTFDLNNRNFVINESILSGDLAGDDDPEVPETYAENAYNVFYHYQTGSAALNHTAILDGFTITGGNANLLQATHGVSLNYRTEQGGGMHNSYHNELYLQRKQGFDFWRCYGKQSKFSRNSQLPVRRQCGR